MVLVKRKEVKKPSIYTTSFYSSQLSEGEPLKEVQRSEKKSVVTTFKTNQAFKLTEGGHSRTQLHGELLILFSL